MKRLKSGTHHRIIQDQTHRIFIKLQFVAGSVKECTHWRSRVLDKGQKEPEMRCWRQSELSMGS